MKQTTMTTLAAAFGLVTVLFCALAFVTATQAQTEQKCDTKDKDCPTSEKKAVKADGDEAKPTGTDAQFKTAKFVADPGSFAVKTAKPYPVYQAKPTPTQTPAVAASGGQDLAQQAADPTAPLMAFTLKDEFTNSFYGVPDSAHAFGFQAVVPFRAWKQANLLRVIVNYDITGPGERGLESVSIFDLIVFSKKWGRWGVGPLVQFAPNRGPGKDTALAGPAIGFVAKKGKWNLGLFNQNLFGQNTRFSSIQPIISYGLGGGWTVASGDAQWSIDWTAPQFVNIPIGVQLAKVSKVGGQPVRFFVNPEYNARNVTGTPHWAIRFGITILAPGK